jgi:seryl-tRNA synthetase
MLEASKEDSPPIKEPSNAPDVVDLLAYFQKMRTEEQELLETKEDLLAKERDLQGKLVKEIDKKKVAIDVLKSEVQNLENRCKEMAQALGSPSTDSSSATDSSN